MTDSLRHQGIPVVEDDGMHVEAAPGITLCGQMTDKDTILGTAEEVQRDRWGGCWTCAIEAEAMEKPSLMDVDLGDDQ